MTKPFSVITLLFLLAGCVSQATFYWGDYSSTLFDYTKAPDEKTLAAHKQSLFQIITESPKKRLRVPPGVYAEYGYLLIKEGKETEGVEYLGKEITLYPESKVFIERLKREIGKGTNHE